MGLGPHRYSVFDHSIACAVLQLHLDGVIRPIPFLVALFHEIGEIVLGDVPSPFKTAHMRSVERQVATNFWIQVSRYLEGVSPEMALSVSCKRADSLLLYVEAEKVLGLTPGNRDQEFSTDESPKWIRRAETIVEAMIHVDPDRSERLFRQFWLACKGVNVSSSVMKSLIADYAKKALK